jgi:hypothetical protein
MKLLSRWAGSTVRRRRCAARPHLLEGVPQPRRSGRHGRRTEAGDPVAWEPPRDLLDRLACAQGVEALDAVDVHVDESRHDRMAVKGERRGSRRGAVAPAEAGAHDAGPDFDNATGVDDEGPGTEDPIRQHEIGA